MGQRRFEWDERKNAANLRKHGLDFEDASDIFEGPIFVRADSRGGYEEDRWAGVGAIQGRVVVVIFTERDEGRVIRIISLRKAQRHERDFYEKAVSH